ncbi:ADYC domain-containing protein [Nannocystis pusilla]|uniref:ADYC domain-containing protein n=1 Tax=Nannocystis pusilla TaxID=889268 RepID=UPI003B806CCB
MITADYCGTGQSFTVQDQGIYWENAAGTVTAPSAAYTKPIEAVWGPNGALCIGEPRLFTLAEVQTECPGLPDCDTVDWANMAYEWITWKVT